MTEDTEYVDPTREALRSSLQKMDPYEFEQLVGDVWERLGWDTRVVGEPGDRGIDVVATTEDGEKQLIQAKRYGPDTTVGSPEVQQYAALRLQEDGVNQVTIVTTGEFSMQARALATDLEVLLVDGEDFLSMLEEIDGWDAVAPYFDYLSVSEDYETPEDGPEDRSVVDRVRRWFS